MSENVWVVISRACEDCGGRVSVQLHDHEPTESEKSENARVAGGTCVRTTVLRASVQGEPVTSDPDE